MRLLSFCLFRLFRPVEEEEEEEEELAIKFAIRN